MMCIYSLLFFFFFLFFIFLLTFSTHLRQFASHRARRWYYHATTFLVSRFRVARPLATRDSCNLAETIAVSLTGRLTSRPRDQRRIEEVKRERYGRKRRNQWDFHRDMITDVSRVPKSHVLPLIVNCFRLTIRRRYTLSEPVKTKKTDVVVSAIIFRR